MTALTYCVKSVIATSNGMAAVGRIAGLVQALIRAFVRSQGRAIGYESVLIPVDLSRLSHAKCA